jgi:hypothetical protein
MRALCSFAYKVSEIIRRFAMFLLLTLSLLLLNLFAESFKANRIKNGTVAK